MPAAVSARGSIHVRCRDQSSAVVVGKNERASKSAHACPDQFAAGVTVSNLSGVDPVDADTTMTLTLPGDCSTGSVNPVTVQNTPVSQAGSPVSIPQQSWSVTCTQPSNHIFTTTAIASRPSARS